MAYRHVEGYSASPALGHRRSGEMRNHAEIRIKSEQYTAAPPKVVTVQRNQGSARRWREGRMAQPSCMVAWGFLLNPSYVLNHVTQPCHEHFSRASGNCVHAARAREC